MFAFEFFPPTGHLSQFFFLRYLCLIQLWFDIVKKNFADRVNLHGLPKPHATRHPLKTVSDRKIGLPLASVIQSFGKTHTNPDRQQVTEDRVHLDFNADAAPKF